MKNIVRRYGIFLLIPIILFIWFQKQVLFGAGESAVPFYNLSLLAQSYNHSWADRILGNQTSLVLSNYPFFYIFSFFEKIHVPSFLIQAFFFAFVFIVSGVGLYLLVKDIFKREEIAILAIIFYWFNFVSMILVWNRSIYSFTAFIGYAPLLLYVFRKGLLQRKYSYIFITNIILLFGSISFLAVPIVLLCFSILFLYFFYYLISIKRTKQELFFSFFYIVLLIILWLLFNSWWLLQFIQSLFTNTYITGTALTPSGDLGTLQVLSDNLGNLAYVFRLMHKDFFTNMREIWGGIYQNPLMIIVSFIGTFLVFGSLLIKKKPKEYYFFLFLSLLALFFAKGLANPFGGIFYFLFTHIRLLEAFRNPFEKIGLVLPLAFAPLYGFTVFRLYQWVLEKNKKYAFYILIIFLFIMHGVLFFPMWNGWIFTSTEPPTNNPAIGDRVKIPDYYAMANNWLNKQKENFRILALPIAGEGITHIWDYGYNGVELSNNIFNKPFISLCTGVQFLCPITQSIQPLLLSNPENLWKALAPLNTGYVMLREDVDYKLRGYLNPNDIKGILGIKTPKITFVKKFGKLSFYKLDKDIFTPKIYGAVQGIYFNDLFDSYIAIVPFSNYQSNDLYFTDPRILGREKLQLNSSKQIIVEAHAFTNKNLDVQPENAVAGLPYVRFLPGSPFYLYTRLKENIGRFLAGNDSFDYILNESDKRIVETYKLLQANKLQLADQTKNQYDKYLDYFLINGSQLDNKNGLETLLKQKYVLENSIGLLKNGNKEKNEYTKTLKTLNSLVRLLQELGVETYFPVDLNVYKSYEVTIPEDGNYSVFLESNRWHDFYTNTNLTAIIDGNKKIKTTVDPDRNNQEVINVKFTKGQHQIDLERPQNKDLVGTTSAEQTFDSFHGEKTYNFPFLQYEPFSTYHISFDYYMERTGLVRSFISQDTDVIVKGKKIPKMEIPLAFDNYYNGWRTFNGDFTPDIISHNAKLYFEVTPSNTCLANNDWFLSQRCNVKSFREGYDSEVTFHIRNLHIVKDLRDKLYVTKNKEIVTKFQKPTITFEMINPAIYKVHVINATSPYFLTFLETFHSLWKAYYITKNKNIEIDENNHLIVNSYANAWYINKSGSYDMLLEFSPEKLLDLGNNIAIFVYVLSGIILLFLFIKERKLK